MTSHPTVLIVDDRPGNLELLEALMSGLAVEPVRAVDGTEAVKLAEQCEPCVVLLDIEMPGIDGFETARLIRALPERAHVPIIFITARHTHAGAVLQGYDAGGVDYLVKPVNPRLVRAKVEVFRQLYTQRLKLEAQSRELERQSKFKSDFLANMSHEFRTPLNAILGFAQLMHQGRVGPVSEQHREFLGDILSSGRHLLALVNDILDLAQVEAGAMGMHPLQTDVTALVEEVRRALMPLLDGHTLTVEIAEDLGQVFVDPERLKQVLFNYLSNAIKFTPPGGTIELECRRQADSLLLEVHDDGVGIPEDQQAELFSEFQRLQGGASQGTPGTGLGLALTRRIVEVQGGEVGVRSTDGEGSTFWARLPLSDVPVSNNANLAIRSNIRNAPSDAPSETRRGTT